MAGCASDHSGWDEDHQAMQEHASSATGHFVLEIVGAKDIPARPGVTGEIMTNPYILAKLFTSDDRGGKSLAPAVRSKLRPLTREPTFLSVRDLMVDYQDSARDEDVMDIVLMDHEPVGVVSHASDGGDSPTKSLFVGIGDAEIGRGSIEVREIAYGANAEPTAVEIDCAKSGRVGGPECLVFVRVLPFVPSAIKTFFVIRHGQSVWNAAQDGGRVHEMVDTDHPLSRLGIQQCLEFSMAWKQAQEDLEVAAGKGANSTGAITEDGVETPAVGDGASSKDWGLIKDFLNADVAISSPLIRAVQTAWIGLKGHPTLKRHGLVLSTAIREHKRTVGGLDTMSNATGDEIAARAEECLVKELGEEARGLTPVVNPGDTTGRWWTPAHRAETDLEYRARFHETWCDLKYRDFNSAILTGHSLFFRELFKRYLAQDFVMSNPSLAEELQKKKLMNAGCVAITVDFSRDGVDPVIINAEPMFGCTLVK